MCCYRGDGMAVTPETTFLTTFRTMESLLTGVHTEHLYKVSPSVSTANTVEYCNEQRGKLILLLD